MFKQNLIANYGGTVFVAVVQVLVIPLYIRLLGESQWGVLSLAIALCASLLIVETGISLAIARSFTVAGTERASAQGRLHWLERRYIFGAATLVATAGITAPLLAPLVFPEAAPDPNKLVFALVTMAAAQIVGSLYRSVIVGIGKQVHFNALLVVFTTLRHAAALVAALIHPGTLVVVSAFASVSVLEACARRRAALAGLRHLPNKTESPRALSPAGAVPLAIAAAIGALTTQIDRLLLSAAISLESLGHYAIAAMLSLAALQLVYPISQALLPRLADFQDYRSRMRVLRQSYSVLGIILFFVWVGAVLLQVGPLSWWLRSEDLAGVVEPLFLVHLAGTSVNALGIPLYLEMLAFRRDFQILGCNVLALASAVSILIAGGEAYGALTGSFAWLVANVVLLLGYLWVLKQSTSAQRDLRDVRRERHIPPAS
jgi:O-antigen/teichoic acid export membrane protein